MANTWVRLWHDMPTDPKWRTIARVSGQPVSLVISMFVTLIVDASRNVTRGNASVTDEDIASLLDVTEEQIKSIRDAMQGRVLDGCCLSGWSVRQPNTEDAGDPERGVKSGVERQREHRARVKEAAKLAAVTERNGMSREVTLDTDKDTDKEQPPLSPVTGCVDVVADQNEPQRKRQTGNEGFESFWLSYPKKVGKGAAEAAWKKAGINGHLTDVLAALANQKNSAQWVKDDGQYVPNPATWLNQKRWLDGDATQQQSSTPSWAKGVV